MKRTITHEEFLMKISDLVGKEYTVIGTYVNSKTKIMMKHNVCNHVYKVSPNNFLRGKRCPKCSGCMKKDTETFKKETYDLVGEEYLVLGEYVHAHKKIKFRHNNISCGNYEFELSPANFLSGTRCLKCAKNKKKTTEDYRREIYDLFGNEYSVLGEYINANTKLTMKHNTCGYTYEARPCNTLRGSKCPKCAQRLKKDTETFKKEVYELVFDEYEVLSEYINSREKISMKHTICNSSYSVTPDNFLRGKRCPICNESKGEKRIREWLEINNIPFISQKEYDNLKGTGGGSLSYDFYIPSQNILIEYQGKQHEEYISGFHKTKAAFKIQQEHDKRKKEYAKTNNIKLLEIWYDDFERIEEILDYNILINNYTSRETLK